MEKLPLEHYQKSLGLQSGQFFRAAGVPPALKRAIKQGHPIALPHAEKIAAYISQEIGRTISYQQISDIKIL